jgi:hypothetical protein
MGGGGGGGGGGKGVVSFYLKTLKVGNLALAVVVPSWEAAWR